MPNIFYIHTAHQTHPEFENSGAICNSSQMWGGEKHLHMVPAFY
jgi:hypothetical protein